MASGSSPLALANFLRSISARKLLLRKLAWLVYVVVLLVFGQGKALQASILRASSLFSGESFLGFR